MKLLKTRIIIKTYKKEADQLILAVTIFPFRTFYKDKQYKSSHSPNTFSNHNSYRFETDHPQKANMEFLRII